MEDNRIVRIPLPVEMVKRIDRLILSGVGGFQTRTDFFREGAQVLLDEYAAVSASAQRPDDALGLEAIEAISTGDLVLDDTALRAPGLAGLMVPASIASVRPQMLFGLHNRDYPSLWALRQLADLTSAGMRDLEECIRLVTAEAWRYGARLSQLETRLGQKLTALFPTNHAKRQSADDAFRNFAIGGCATTADGVIAAGPLFEWEVCAVGRDASNHLVVGVTEPGYVLLNSLDGLSLRLPHAQRQTDAFLKHLQGHDNADWGGFRFVVKLAGAEATREELVDGFARILDQRQDQAPTYAAGYIARAREWGLIEPKQRHGRYELTALGEEFAATTGGPQ